MNLTTKYKKENYTIHIDYNIFEKVLSDYTSSYENIFYIIDEYVFELHANRLENFKNIIKAPRGENFKSIESTISIIDNLLEQEIKRNDLIVVIGGGATGDAGAFISSITLRGVDYIHVPTTLLSHDSSIGGKTAINRPSGKNLVGTFYRPIAVIYDLSFLESLSEEEILSGFGEVLKHAMLHGEEKVNNLLKTTEQGIFLKDLDSFIISGIKTKMYYVTVDETESNLRRYLNLGHTLGHTLECHYKLKHGHAVVLGILFSLYLSNQMYESDFNIEILKNYTENLGFDLSPLKNMDIGHMIHLMSHDKKNQTNDFIGYILLKEYGNPNFIEISVTRLKNYLESFKVML